MKWRRVDSFTNCACLNYGVFELRIEGNLGGARDDDHTGGLHPWGRCCTKRHTGLFNVPGFVVRGVAFMGNAVDASRGWS